MNVTVPGLRFIARNSPAKSSLNTAMPPSPDAVTRLTALMGGGCPEARKFSVEMASLQRHTLRVHPG
jgi:hypothetical protein